MRYCSAHTQKNGMSYQVTKRHEGNLNVYYKKPALWQKPAQNCKAKSFQLKYIYFFNAMFCTIST